MSERNDKLTSEAEALEAVDALRALHAEIDREAERVAAQHGDRLQCGLGCSTCCLDDLSVKEVEAARIREAHPKLLSEGRAGPAGACAFLDDEGACRIYAERPSVCRSQGLPLRVFYEDGDEIVERRDICPLNAEGGPPLEALDEEACWLVGPFELRLATIDARYVAATGRGRDGDARVALRSLFANG